MDDEMKSAYSEMGLEWQRIAPSNHQRGFVHGYAFGYDDGYAAALASNQPVKLYNKTGETLQSIDDAEGRN